MEQTGISGADGKLHWSVGVPVATNPIIFKDILCLAAIVWAGGAVLAACVQLFAGNGLNGAALLMSLAYAGLLSLGVVALFLFAGLFLISNRYGVFYKMDDQIIYCETTRGELHGKAVGLLRWKPYPVDPLIPYKSSIKTVYWEDIQSVLPVPSFRAMILKGKYGGSMRIYCPDDATFEAALAAVSARVAEERPKPM